MDFEKPKMFPQIYRLAVCQGKGASCLDTLKMVNEPFLYYKANE